VFHGHRGKQAFHVCALAVILAFLSTISAAQATPSKDPKISAVSAVITQPATLYVLFDRPYPDQGDVNSPNDWVIFVTNKVGKVSTVSPTTVISIDVSAPVGGKRPRPRFQRDLGAVDLEDFGSWIRLRHRRLIMAMTQPDGIRQMRQ